MILPKPQDAIYKLYLYRLLSAIIDDKLLAQNLYFKGGTCAAMLGWLDRFSIDLDFDLIESKIKPKIHKNLLSIFIQLGLKIKQQSKKELFYILQYQSNKTERNSLKLSIVINQIKANKYETLYLPEIDRYCWCQTKETTFSNKLVAPIDRYKKYRTIAGRDIYDIHYFFSQGFAYLPMVIEERTGKKVKTYLQSLYQFIDKKVNEKIITQDLNYLLSIDMFQRIRKRLKSEVLLLLKSEIERWEE